MITFAATCLLHYSSLKFNKVSPAQVCDATEAQ